MLLYHTYTSSKQQQQQTAREAKKALYSTAAAAVLRPSRHTWRDDMAVREDDASNLVHHESSGVGVARPVPVESTAQAYADHHNRWNDLLERFFPFAGIAAEATAAAIKVRRDDWERRHLLGNGAVSWRRARTGYHGRQRCSL